MVLPSRHMPYGMRAMDNNVSINMTIGISEMVDTAVVLVGANRILLLELEGDQCRLKTTSTPSQNVSWLLRFFLSYVH